MRSVEHSADRIALIILAIIAVIAGITFGDYGLGWDDVTQSQYGDLLLKLYGSGFHDQRALSFVNLYKYGGGFDMAAALAAKVLPFGLFETRRLVGAIVGIIGLIVTWRLGRRLGGPVAGVAALLLLAACPLYYGHMFMNPKDAPFAVAMTLLLLGLVRAFDEYPKPSLSTMLLTGIGIGTAFGSRVLAGLAALEGSVVFLMIVAVQCRNESWRAAVQAAGRFLQRILPAPLIGYAIMALLWPWSVVRPLNPFYAAEYFDTFFEKPWKELYDGRLIAVPDMPAGYLPHLFALKLPLLLLALGLAGTVGALIAAARHDTPPNRRAVLLLMALAALSPIAIAMLTRPALYNGLRHFIFVVPPFAALGGLAVDWLAARTPVSGKMALATVIMAGLALPVVGMVRLHPYEYAYFNPLIGGVRGAQDRYMLDYWGLAFKQAALALRAHLAAAHEIAPPGRRWVVAVCGPEAAAGQDLGPKFETTFDQKKADFAMTLGTFYCRQLDAPLLADIKRAGVTFARVYDLRGRPMPNLLTLPPPQ